MKLVKVSEETYRKLNVLAGKLRAEQGKPVSMDAVIFSLAANSSGGDYLKETLVQALQKRNEVLACYLFGSVAKGMEGEDIDLGILLKEDGKQDPLYEGELAVELEKAGLKNVDVRILNHASVRFLNQVLRHGKLLFCRDERARVLFEASVMTRHLDLKPLYARYDRMRAERMTA
ncbi:MAG: nucleotidyltransferase domain-containing protein [Candidatus Aenigmarchaeota archaeon]|nr:nucleotidyltransferase domain-containing protein [Candidatus Aenigmarchaeota archaeon]